MSIKTYISMRWHLLWISLFTMAGPGFINIKAQDIPSLPEIQSISADGDNLTLDWDGGLPPYAIDKSSDLIEWQETMITGETSSEFPAESPVFFRVRTTDKTPPGTHIGQLRTGEGEFHDALELHRMKTIWDFYLPAGQETVSSIPAEYFESLVIKMEYMNGAFDGTRQFIGQLSDLPSAAISTNAQIMTVRWRFSDNNLTRAYTLEMQFPYPLNTARKTIHLSDPQFTLKCQYSRPQPNLVTWPAPAIETTTLDECFLYELEDSEEPTWYNRSVRVNLRGVKIDGSYKLGVPNYQGSPAWIFKTPVLNFWKSTQISMAALNDEPITFSNRFARTYAPGHHNFWEIFLFDPALEPGVSESQRQDLRDANIRYIFLTAGPEVDKPELLFIGFDNTVR